MIYLVLVWQPLMIKFGFTLEITNTGLNTSGEYKIKIRFLDINIFFHLILLVGVKKAGNN